MILILEIIFLIAGLWAIATGKLPAFLFGGGHYTAEGTAVRLLGILLILPLPLAFMAGIVLGLLFGEDAPGYAVVTEIVIVIGVAIAASIAFRFVRRPVTTTDSGGQVADDAAKVETRIAKKAQGALIYSLLGILGFTAIVVCPLAFVYASQALRLIDEHKLGERYRNQANLARIIAVGVFTIYAGIVCFLLSLVIVGRLGQ